VKNSVYYIQISEKRVLAPETIKAEITKDRLFGEG
jgi:hypothetical protein